MSTSSSGKLIPHAPQYHGPVASHPGYRRRASFRNSPRVSTLASPNRTGSLTIANATPAPLLQPEDAQQLARGAHALAICLPPRQALGVRARTLAGGAEVVGRAGGSVELARKTALSGMATSLMR